MPLCKGILSGLGACRAGGAPVIDLTKVFSAMTLTMNNLNDLKWNKDVIFPVLSYLY